MPARASGLVIRLPSYLGMLFSCLFLHGTQHNDSSTLLQGVKVSCIIGMIGSGSNFFLRPMLYASPPWEEQRFKDKVWAFEGVCGGLGGNEWRRRIFIRENFCLVLGFASGRLLLETHWSIERWFYLWRWPLILTEIFRVYSIPPNLQILHSSNPSIFSTRHDLPTFHIFPTS